MNERVYELRNNQKLVDEIKEILNIDLNEEIDIYSNNDDNEYVEGNIICIDVENKDKRYTFYVELILDDEGNIKRVKNARKNNDIEITESTNKKIKRNKLNFDIDYWSYNITYDQLARLYEQKLIIIPKMQRDFVWDKAQASRLIESIFMGLPLPSLFLVKQENGKYIVVDGLQRITTIYCFRYNKPLPIKGNRQKNFSLIGVDESFKGLTYDKIQSTSLQNKFDMGTINVIEFKQNKPDHEKAMYTLFERLNSGGTSLSNQQIRNSVYYGTFNDKLNSFAKENLDIYFSNRQQLNLLPSELALRSISIFNLIKTEKLPNIVTYKKLYDDTELNYHLAFKKANLNEDQKKIDELKKHVDEIFNLLKNAITKSIKIFGKNVFKRYDPDQQKFMNRITPVIFESLTVCIMLNPHKKLKNACDIIENYKSVISRNFDRYFSQSTGKKENIEKRIALFEKILFKDVKCQ